MTCAALFRSHSVTAISIKQWKLFPSHSQNDDHRLLADDFKEKMRYQRVLVLKNMFVGIAFASSDDANTLNFFFLGIVRILGLIDLGEQQA
jgi:hypothetical protein